MLRSLKKAGRKLRGRQSADGVMDEEERGYDAPGPGNAFLHGTLRVKIVEARNVEGKGLNFMGLLERAVTSSIDGVDPYCSVKLGYNKILQTPVVQNDASPKWSTEATFDLCNEFEALEFRLKAAKRSGPLSIVSKVKHLSMFSITAEEIKAKNSLSGWFPLVRYQAEKNAFGVDDSDSESDDDNGADGPEDGSYGDLHVQIEYIPVGGGNELRDVHAPRTYFPARHGVNVKFYQDADCPPGSLPVIPFRPNYEHGRCYRDMSKAIMEATEFIYITGWAVWPELVMVRTDYPGDEWKGLTIGEMLKQKAEEGVTVCIMVWDELASGRFHKGIMGTHDEEIIDYFKKSKVNAAKVGRINPKDGPFADLNASVMFTHHQKTIIVAKADPSGGKSRVRAFVGGLDVTDGRYDNNQHSLFRTLDGLHAPPDFWQACALDVTAESGPREGWHDIHMHVTGTAAWDVLTNFEGRWVRQAGDKLRSALHSRPANRFVTPPEEDKIRDGDWSVQVLRSINESSTALDSRRPGLCVRRNANIDQSIHHAYVHAIRSAKHFIYIENQYFLGSSHMWDRNSSQRGGFSSHLVPIEIAEKICAKIRAGQRFAVYANIPMYPEGPPDSAAVQEILSHQRKTINMITARIAETIKETGSDTQITDWFNVFCIVNRESPRGGKGNGGTNEMEQTLSASRRFMIYLHSKFAVFDDTSAIIGSANINGRSMDGSRDTEIATMSWQPKHRATGSTGYSGDTAEGGSLPQGDVAAFRCSVWSEHLAGYFPEMQNPSSLECVRKIRSIAQVNWDHFASDTVEDMPCGHLALYPYEFDPETGVTETTTKNFPDFPNALVRGKAMSTLPNELTG